MGRRTLQIASGFLPVLMSKGVHHYFVGNDAVPDDCRIVDAWMADDDRSMILLLESEEWEWLQDGSTPRIEPMFFKHHCPGEDA